MHPQVSSKGLIYFEYLLGGSLFKGSTCLGGLESYLTHAIYKVHCQDSISP